MTTVLAKYFDVNKATCTASNILIMKIISVCSPVLFELIAIVRHVAGLSRCGAHVLAPPFNAEVQLLAHCSRTMSRDVPISSNCHYCNSRVHRADTRSTSYRGVVYCCWLATITIGVRNKYRLLRAAATRHVSMNMYLAWLNFNMNVIWWHLVVNK